MGKTAFIYPGQGSQYVGMGKDLYQQFDEAKILYDQANKILGFDLISVSFKGPEDELKQTRITQPAIFVHSAVVTRLLGQQPDMVAGHSLGEYSSLVAAGTLSFEDALRLVKLRGELMQDAGEEFPGTMAAIIGMEVDEIEAVCKDASSSGIVQPANFNSPGQVVISGSTEGVHRAMELAKERGAKRAIELVVSAAFHSPLMEPAKEKLGEALSQIEFQETEIPIYTNVTSKPVSKPDEIRQSLFEQLTSPVRWTESIRNMIQDGAVKFIEVGPGAVLKGLMKRIDRSVEAQAVGTTGQLENTN